MNKIAVITPVYNSENFIKQCLSSVALSNIDGFSLEHIVVDDGSTDHSWEIIQATRSPYLKIFHLDKNSGGSIARNFGIKQTDADWLFCLDADDVIFQNSLKSLWELSKKQSADWIYGDFIRTNENLGYLIGEDYYGFDFSSPAQLLTSMLLGEHFFQQNCFYHRNLFESVDGFDENKKHAQDFDLFLRFTIKNILPKYYPCPLYLHRFHPDNLSKKSGREYDFEKHKEDIGNLYREYESEIKKILHREQLDRINTFLQSNQIDQVKVF